MDKYYTPIIIVTLLTLLILCILVWENDRLRQKDKQMLYISYTLVAVAALAEWFGLYLSGNDMCPVWVLRTVKCVDYILTPLAGGSIVAQLRGRRIKYSPLLGILAFNTLFQIVSVFTGWMITVDSGNHYTKGPLYMVYIVIYLLVILITIIETISYGRSFRRVNRQSLYAILLLIAVGILMQEILSFKPRISYITLAIGMALLFIHNSEYLQLAADDRIREQMVHINTDAMTGLFNRYAYANALKDLDAQNQLPEGLAVFSIDINGLKTTNDTKGHSAGDELICAGAKCIESVLSPWGDCYRTGGDEFVVLAEMNRNQAKKAISRLALEAASWCGDRVKELHMAAGYALSEDYPTLSSEKLIQKADRAMYKAKAAYYLQSGEDRRRSGKKKRARVS